ncbi:PREDICTED: serine/threonine receptor kinase [Prunus dulcis]|uniref:PREDICTED: serine/threonine receptor kinase n=1 Tax=Prunus dulcis TaxID=3755 RepID=A0A5E4E3X3_PRUDU|nr:hypothetical protein L3X38_040089 [Prunus dulcis]VVA10514.1 PREDICTED: serine/threonine receptor kinase [Prunus dulcis]
MACNMHDHTQPSIVHWDLRAKNILLNSNFKAKIANFSMARTVADPIMPKVDVFAFGVVLLELLSGKKALETKDKGEIVMLCKELRAVLKNEEERVDRLIKWMDPKLENCYPIDRALSLAALAYKKRPWLGQKWQKLSLTFLFLLSHPLRQCINLQVQM